jgi:AAA family ATPase
LLKLTWQHLLLPCVIVVCRFASVKHCLSSAEIHQLAATTHGFVGADLAALVNESAMTALRRHVRAQQQHEQGQQQQSEAIGQQQQQQKASSLCVTWKDVCAARLLIKPSALREVAIEVPQVKLFLSNMRINDNSMYLS